LDKVLKFKDLEGEFDSYKKTIQMYVDEYFKHNYEYNKEK